MLVARKVAAAAMAEASKLGASISFRPGSKHVLMEVMLGEARRQTTLSNSPNKKREVHQEDWVRQFIRRAVKEMKSCNTSTPSKP